MTDGHDLVRRAVDAFNAVDAEAFAALAHPEFLFQPLLTRSASGQPYRGTDGARQYVRDASAWARTTIEIQEIADHRDIIVAHGRLTIRVDTREAVVDVAYVARLKDGLVAEMATLADVGEAARQLGMQAPEPAGPPLHMSVAAVPQNIPAIRTAVREFARTRGIEDVHAVMLCVTEAATNVVLHAYLDDETPGPVEVVGEDEPGGIVISVADEGRGLRPRLGSPGLGLGLSVMQQSATEIAFRGPPQREAGTEVRLKFARDAA